MSVPRAVGLVLLTLAAGGCAAVRLPAWVPFQRGAAERPDGKPGEPRRVVVRVDPAVAPPPGSLDPKTVDMLYRAAQVYIVEQRDDDAYRALTQITRISPQYKDSPVLLRDVRTRLVRYRYQEGLRLFREERLEDAITEWRIVLELDPTQTPARRSIDQAEQMLRTLAEHGPRR
jgi:cytochrome c-type biogenesis protein CcmH/NrfG